MVGAAAQAATSTKRVPTCGRVFVKSLYWLRLFGAVDNWAAPCGEVLRRHHAEEKPWLPERVAALLQAVSMVG